MSRNRIKNSQSLHWMGVVKWVLILGLVSLLGLSYMFCKNQNLRLAEETHRLEHKLELIQQRNVTLQDSLDGMKSPAVLKRRLVQMHSSLVALYDPRMIAHVTRMEGQSTRMILEKMETFPHVNAEAHPIGTIESVNRPGLLTPPTAQP